MQTLDNISNDGKQKHTILLDSDSSRIVLELTYKPTQLGWFLDVTYDDLGFEIHNLRVTTNSNLLNQWKNKLPFGIMCQGKDAQDPLLVEDFLVGRCSLSILSAEEVKMFSEIQGDLRGEDF